MPQKVPFSSQSLCCGLVSAITCVIGCVQIVRQGFISQAVQMSAECYDILCVQLGYSTALAPFRYLPAHPVHIGSVALISGLLTGFAVDHEQRHQIQMDATPYWLVACRFRLGNGRWTSGSRRRGSGARVQPLICSLSPFC